MKLITIDNYELKVADEALLVKPIRRLWNMDRTIGKEKFYQQMSVLFFVYDPRSNYAYIVDESDRLKEVLAQEGIKDWHNTAEFKAAVEVYKKLTTTPSSILLSSTLIAIDKVSKFLEDLNFEKVNEKSGAPLYSISSVVTAIKQIPQLSKDIQLALKSVGKELEEQGKVRGSQELTVLDSATD